MSDVKIYLKGKHKVAQGAVDLVTGGGDFWLALVDSTSSFMDDEPEFMDEFVTPGIIGTDQNLNTLTVVEDAAKDRVYIPSDVPAQAPTFAVIPAHGTITGAILYYKVTNYSDSIPLVGIALGTPYKISVVEDYIFPVPDDGFYEWLSSGERFYLQGRKQTIQGYDTLARTYEVLAVKEGSGFFLGNPHVIGDISPLNESAGSGYSRQSVAITLVENLAQERLEITPPSNVSFGVLGVDSAPIIGIVFINPDTVNALADTLYFGLRLTQPFTADGVTEFDVCFDDTGLAYL